MYTGNVLLKNNLSTLIRKLNGILNTCDLVAMNGSFSHTPYWLGSAWKVSTSMYPQDLCLNLSLMPRSLIDIDRVGANTFYCHVA